jgi:UDP-galactopyranose mutase
MLATRYGIQSMVLEADDMVGGISRSVERDGYRFDLGGHRFFTKVPEVDAMWREILPGEEFMLRPRMSRIFYRGKYFDYPLRATNALKNLGPVETVRCIASYLWARVRPPKNQDTLEGWVIARFGRRLYEHLFKTYNEKLWGVPVSKLPADFAAQRIKNLSLVRAAMNSIMPRRNQTEITSLIGQFHYPKYGPGMMWERCRDICIEQGTEVVMNAKVVAIEHVNGEAKAVLTQNGAGVLQRYECDHVISSMPLSQLAQAMNPSTSEPVQAAAGDLRYRDFLTVALVVPESAGFPDNWIYIHALDVQVGRIQNFGAWSPFLVKEDRTCLGMEYFVFEGDETWNKSDDDLIEQAKQELQRLRLVDAGQVEAGYVVRVPKAYPFYDQSYKSNVATITRWLSENATNVYPVGRNGMHRYNNQDHSMFTAMLTAENIATGTTHDVWNVNVEQEYHETKAPATSSNASGGTGRDAPVINREHYDPDHPLNREPTT